MPESERKQQIKHLIRTHLADVGGSQWKAVRLQCPEISEATFWRYVDAVRHELDKEAEPNHLNFPHDQGPEGDAGKIVGLPPFYNPLEKARLYETLLADAETMRTQAVDHRGKIINWRMFEKSIQLRERLVCQQREAVAFFQSQEATELLYRELIELTDDLPPEAVKKFLERVSELYPRRLATKI